MNKIPLLIILLFCVNFANAQSSWKKIDSENYNAKTELEHRKSTPTKFDLYSLDTESFKDEIDNNTTIVIPINGELSSFYIKEASNFTNTLASKYGYIKSFSLKGIDDSTATGKISVDTQGVHAIIFSGKHSTIYIDPYTKNKSTYIAYNKSDLHNDENHFNCLTDNNLISKQIYSEVTTAKKNANDGILRTYRLALACTVEYSAFHINNQEVTNGTEDEKKAAVLSAMNTTISRVNGIFERDLAVTMNIVVNNGGNELIFIDSDDFTSNNASELIEENQEVCDDIIGSNNYDIGHIFNSNNNGIDGLAGFGVLCVANEKAKGVTGSFSPIGDAFDIDVVAHEFGHQFGANHTFNGSAGSCSGENRNNSTAVEPGSGSTIMAYAGICTSQNVQNNSDAYFHAVSIDQMWRVVQNNSCASETNTNNTAPTVNAGSDFSVPKSTPLILKGEASDLENNDSLTYCWEQTDTEIVTTPPLATSIAGASFRSLPPTTSPNRYLPELPTVLSGSTESEWEVIPSVARNMNFSLVVRDNNIDGGATERDDMTVTVIDTDPFVVTSQNTAVSWEVGTTETITWNTSTTNQTPIDCNNVKISLSLDGGETFPIILTESTANDGSYDAVVPDQLTANARIMIEAVDNIFYNVNTIDFSIISSGPIFVFSNASTIQEICSDVASSVTYLLDVDFINDFSETVNLSLGDLPNGVSASISSSSITESTQISINLTNLEDLDVGSYSITISGNSTSIPISSIELPALIINSAVIEEINLSSPANNSTNVSSEEIVFEWSNSITNFLMYDFEIATDINFSNIIIQDNLLEPNYTYSGFLDFDTTYYWRVKPKNICIEGNYSSVFNFTTEGAGYCDSDFTNTGDESEFISNVSFNSINNNSGNDDTDNTLDGYEDFTNTSTTLIRGFNYPLSVSLDPVGFQDHCYVFIDWNNDTRFDIDTERYNLGSHFSETTTSMDITVPQDAILGETRMRVIIEYFENEISFGNGACNTDHNWEFGETEDYTLLITDLNVIGVDDVFENFSLFPNPTDNFIFLTFNISNLKEDVLLYLSDATGRIVKSFIASNNTSELFNKNINLEGLQTGVYFLRIQNGNKETVKKIIIK